VNEWNLYFFERKQAMPAATIKALSALANNWNKLFFPPKRSNFIFVTKLISISSSSKQASESSQSINTKRRFRPKLSFKSAAALIAFRKAKWICLLGFNQDKDAVLSALCVCVCV